MNIYLFAQTEKNAIDSYFVCVLDLDFPYLLFTNLNSLTRIEKKTIYAIELGHLCVVCAIESHT